jgi:XTP/dITP diphosphohydrolase
VRAGETWVLASGNRGKLVELEAIFADAGIALTLQSELGIDSAEETGSTFVENALIKARHASRLAGRPTVADDSGLVVDAIGGRPGVLSARFAGPDASDADNIDALLLALADVPDAQRTARFYCALVALRRPDDPAPGLAVGQWEGRIALTRRGQGGFGYDPVFIDATTGKSAAELTMAEKNRVSHRGKALASLRAVLGHGE